MEPINRELEILSLCQVHPRQFSQLKTWALHPPPPPPPPPPAHTHTHELKTIQCDACLFGVLRGFQHCTGHTTTGSWKGRGNQYIQFARVLYCKLPTNGKQLPAFPLKAMTGIEPRPQRWEARVLPLCHRGPLQCDAIGILLQITYLSTTVVMEIK